MATLAPARAAASAMARPMPVEAPVTTTLAPASAAPALADREPPAGVGGRSLNRLPRCVGFRRVAGEGKHTGAATRHKGTLGRFRVRLLISVANADEARAALDGGADIIDAKDPGAGALGSV